MEYEYALSVGKTIIAFLPQNPDNIPNGKCEASTFWTEPANLGITQSSSIAYIYAKIIIRFIKNYKHERCIYGI